MTAAECFIYLYQYVGFIAISYVVLTLAAKVLFLIKKLIKGRRR